MFLFTLLKLCVYPMLSIVRLVRLSYTQIGGDTMKKTMKKIFIGIWICTLLSTLVGIGVLLNMPKPTTKRELVSMINSTRINGNFFLGCGSINQEPVFYYYYKTVDGAIKLTYVNANKTTIYEDIVENQAPYTIIIGQNELVFGNSLHEFHLPPNSIKPDFDLSINNLK